MITGLCQACVLRAVPSRRQHHQRRQSSRNSRDRAHGIMTILDPHAHLHAGVTNTAATRRRIPAVDRGGLIRNFQFIRFNIAAVPVRLAYVLYSFGDWQVAIVH